MSMNDNPYQTPQSPLQGPGEPPRSVGGNLEDALAGRYELNLSAIFEEAWGRIRGVKAVFWLAVLIQLGVFMLGSLVAEALDKGGFQGLSLAAKLALNLVTAPMSAALLLMAARRAVDMPIRAEEVLRHFPRMLPLFLTSLMGGLIIVVFFGLGLSVANSLKNPLGWLLAGPGVYLAVTYQFATLLVIEKGLRPWQALETSRRALSHQFGKMFLLMLCMSLVVALGSLVTLAVGLIWLMPFALLAQGIAYRQVFGVTVAGGMAAVEGRLTA
ncbi:MAG: hypothetical protein HYV16_15075 [Gammaproteobacteria bacterium]|nr:hypothetical protein [Gammaproteobacteria bacterium]